MQLVDPTATFPIAPPAPRLDGNERRLYGAGAWLDPLIRLSTFDSAKFETFVREWVEGYLGNQYNQVHQRGASGDKGRDIVAWVDPPGTLNRRWHLYQCKHYKDPFRPSDFHIELAKLCYYVNNGDYSMPEQYFLVTHKGIGNDLGDLIDNPEKLSESLQENWDNQCSARIERGKIHKLEGALLAFVRRTDFSIVQAVSPSKLIEQHATTKYHSYEFGTKLKPRGQVSPPPIDPAPCETRYVAAMYGAFAEHLGGPISSPNELSSRAYLKTAFDNARVCFYTAEQWKEFSRDQWPDSSAFDAITDVVHEGVRFAMGAPHQDGFERMREVCQIALSVQIDANNPLGPASPNDRIGICHQLANRGEIKWVVKDG